jgi:aspartate kinase
MFRTLADLDINLRMISTSPIKISCMISRDELPTAVRALHDAFELETPPAVEA